MVQSTEMPHCKFPHTGVDILTRAERAGEIAYISHQLNVSREWGRQGRYAMHGAVKVQTTCVVKGLNVNVPI